MSTDTNNTTPETVTEARTYLLKDLCMLTDIPLRTVRYYIQIGLVDRPVGGTKAARYGAGHLEQLLTVKKWTAAGLALESIRELMHGETPPVEARAKTRGSVAVQSHLTVAGGIELVVDPEAAGLKPEQLRKFFREVTAVYDRIIGDDGSQSEIRR